MAVNQPSFKIFVGTFTPRNTTVSGNDVTVYRIGSIKYELAKILDSVEVINDYYDNELGYPDVSCTENILGCNEQIVTTTTTTGSTGATGAQGPQGIQGRPGANGVAGKSTVILFAGDPNSAKPNEDPILIDQTITIPTASITDATPNTTDPTKQNQTLQFTFPPMSTFTGGGGGSITVAADTIIGQQVKTNVETLQFGRGYGIDFGVDNSTSHISRIQITSRLVGYIALQSCFYTPSTSISFGKVRFTYRGYPSLHLVDNTATYNLNRDPNILSETEIDVINVAEIGVGWDRVLPLYPIFSQSSGVTYAVREPLASSPNTMDVLVPLYKGPDGTFYINQPNTLHEIKLKGRITAAEPYGSPQKIAKWRYTVELGEIDTTDLLNMTTEGPKFSAQPLLLTSSPTGISSVYAYNTIEMANTSSQAYSYLISAYSSTTSPKGFRLTTASNFVFSHVPLNTPVDISFDSYGYFNFSAPNTIVGGCS